MTVVIEIIVCTKKTWCGGCDKQINFGEKYMKITAGSAKRIVSVCADCSVNFAERLQKDSLYFDKGKEVVRLERRDKDATTH